MTPASRQGDTSRDHGEERVDGHAVRRPDAQVDAHSGPEMAEATDCSRHLAAADAALVVTPGSAPRTWLAARDDGQDVAFVATYPHPDCHRTLSDPADTAGIALAVEEWLEALPAGAAPAVCLVGLDTLHEYAGLVETNRFLQVVSGRVRAAGGRLHCHDDVDTAAVAPDRELLVDATR